METQTGWGCTVASTFALQLSELVEIEADSTVTELIKFELPQNMIAEQPKCNEEYASCCPDVVNEFTRPASDGVTYTYTIGDQELVIYN